MSEFSLRKFSSTGKINKLSVKSELIKQSAAHELAEKGTIYQVIDQQTGKAPANLILRRKGKSLLVVVDNQVVLELDNFFVDAETADKPAYLINESCLESETFDAEQLDESDLVNANSVNLQHDGDEVGLVWEACAIGESAAGGELGSALGLTENQLLWGGLGLLGAGGIGAAIGGFGGSSKKASPTAPTGLTAMLDDGSDSGTKGDLITNDNTPTLIGKGTAGDTITIKDASGNVIATATVKADGTWSATPNTALPEGLNKLLITETNSSGLSSSVPLSITIDDTVPNIGRSGLTTFLEITQGADNVGTVNGALSDGDITDDTTPTLTISAEPGSTVNVYDGTTLLGTAVEDPQNPGTFSFTPASPLVDGPHEFTATATDAAGNTSAPTAVFDLIVDTIAPTMPLITQVFDNAGTATGALSDGDTTDDTTPTLTISAEPGSTVNVYDGTTLLGTAVEDPQNPGTFSFTPNNPLSNGWQHQFTVTATDPAGNTSAPSVPFDLIVPTAPVITQGVDDVGTATRILIDGDSTDDNTPTLTISAEPGTTVAVFDGAILLGTAVEDPQNPGTFSFTPASPLADGPHVFTATATDAAGNVSPPTADFDLIVDTIAPAMPVITQGADNEGTATGPLSDGDSTDDTTPTLTISAEPGSTVEIYDGTTLLGTAVEYPQNPGTFSFTPASPLADGPHALTATATDAAGNTSAPTAVFDLIVDTIAPAVPVITQLVDNSGSATGPLIDGDSSDDNTPTLTINAEPGSTVHVYDGTTLLGTAVEDPQNPGTFSLTPASPLADGPHEFTVTATDAVGNTSAPTAVFDLIVDTIAPAMPVITQGADNAGAVTGTLNDGDTTDDNTPTLTISAEPGSTVNIFDGSTLLGTAVEYPQNPGTFSFTPTIPLADGPHALTATATDAAGNTSAPTAAFNLTVDTTAPAVPVIAQIVDNVGTATGPLSDGDSSDDNTPTLTISAEPGSTVNVYDGTTLLGTAVEDPQNPGTFSFTPASPLADGLHEFTVTATDAVGNTSAPTAVFDLTVDTIAPAVPVLTQVVDNFGTVTGPLSDGDITDDNAPTLTISAEPGSTVDIYDGTTLLGTAVEDPQNPGIFSFTPNSPLTNGSHPITITVTDEAGNTSAPTAPFNLVIDAPLTNQFVGLAIGISTDTNNNGYVNPSELNSSVPVFETRVSFDPQRVVVGDQIRINATNGSSALAEQIVTLRQADIANGYVDAFFAKPSEGVMQTVTATFVDTQGRPATDPAPTDSASLDTIAPNQPVTPTSYADDVGTLTDPNSTASVTDDNKPGLNIGPVPAGETPKLYVDGQPVAATYDPVTGTLTPTTALPDGLHNLAYSLTDTAGNESPVSAALPITVDTMPPAQPTAPTSYADNIGTVTNPTSTASVTDDNKPGLNIGTVPAGTTPTLYVDGQPVAATYDPVTGTLTPTTALPDGLHNLAYSLTDTAGNESPLSPTLAVTVDTTPPAQPTAPSSYADNIGTVTNPTSSAAITDDTNPGLNIGTVPAGETPKLYVDGQPVAATYDPVTGTLTPTTALPDGLHNLAYSLTDTAGNESPVSTALPITVDTTPPAQPTAPTSYADDVGALTNPSSSAAMTDDSNPGLNIGTVPVGTTPTLYVDGQAVPATYDPVSGTLTPDTALPDGLHTLAYSLTDTAGNESLVSNPLTITVDAPPTNAEMMLTLEISTDADDNAYVVGQEIAGSSWFISHATFDATKAVVGDQIVFTATNGTTVQPIKTAKLTAADIANGWVDIIFKKPTEGQTQTVTANYVDAGGNAAVDTKPTDSATLDTIAPTNAAMILNLSISTDSNNNAWVSAAELQNASTFTTRITFNNNQAVVGDKIVVNATNGTQALTAQTVTLTQTDITNGYIDVNFDKPAEGELQTVRANYVDAAGNLATDSQPTDNAALDTSVPAQPTAPSNYADNIGTVTNPTSTASVTDDNKPGLNIGTVPAGTTPTLYVDGQPVASTYDPVTGTLTPTVALSDGPHDLAYSLTDTAGNESPVSAALPTTVDTTPPAKPTAPTSYADNIGTLTDPNSTASVTDDNKPSLNIGTVPSGETPKLYVDGQPVAATYDPLTGTLTPTNPLPDGAHNLTYTLTDTAGNESQPSNPMPVTVDTFASNAAISLALSITTDTNNNAWVNNAEWNGALSFTSRATFDHTKVAPGDQLVFTAINENGSAYEEVVILTAQDITAGYVNVDFLRPANGNLQTVTVNLTDAAGNVATDTKPTDNARLDTTAPVTPTISSVNDNVGASQGTVAQGALTDDNRPTLVGTAEPNSTVTVFDNGTVIGSTTADVNGNWNFTPTTALPDGNHSFTAQSTDPAGNQSGVTAAAAIDVSTIQVAIANSTFTSTTVTSGQVIETFDSFPYDVTTNGQIGTFFGDGTGYSIGFNVNNTQQSAQNYSNTITFNTLNVTRVRFNYYDLQQITDPNNNNQPSDKTITYYNASGNVIGTQNMSQVGNGSGFIDSGNLGQAVKRIEFTGGMQDLYAVDRLVIDATNITTSVNQTVSSGSSVVTTTPTLNGTLSRALVAGESLRIFANNIDAGAANVSGTNWTYNASLPAGTTVNYSARVVIGGVAVSESSNFTLTQSNSGTTPLILDLNGDGVQTSTLASGVNFDLNADGQLDQTAWVVGGDGLLVLDRNGNGSIDDGQELFGAATPLVNGGQAKDGFEALQTLDSNGDGLIDANDLEFGSLAVWVDSNVNGASEVGEIRSMNDLGITSLSLTHQTGSEIHNGNIFGLISDYKTVDGQTHEMVDVWLQNQTLPVLNLDAVLKEGVVDLRNDSAEVFKLSVGDVLQLPENSNGQHQLEIVGDSNDIIHLDSLLADGNSAAGHWSQNGTAVHDGQTFNVYLYSAEQSIQVMIDNHIAQTNVNLS